MTITLRPSILPPLLPRQLTLELTGPKQPTQCLVDAARAIQVDDLGSEELSMNVIRQKQREDPQYVDMIAYLDVGSLPSDQAKRSDVLSTQSSYFLHNDVLFHIWTQRWQGTQNHTCTGTTSDSQGSGPDCPANRT